MSDIIGIWGRPYIDIEPYLDVGIFPELHREISRSLAIAEDVMVTGGHLKSLGLVAPWVAEDPYVDFGQVIRRFDLAEFAELVALADDPTAFDLRNREQYTFEEDSGHRLNAAQRRYLMYRYGVYFPWSVFYELMSEHEWADKNYGAGKRFHDEAAELFPKTIEFVHSLPFAQIGRCVLFGMNPNDHVPAHRDEIVDLDAPLDHSINFAPTGSKRFYLTDEARARTVNVPSRAFWFNEMDYHGVQPAPTFQYSLRVDGVFKAEFLERLKRDQGSLA